jgi:cytochrome c oxidase subunit 3
MSEARGAVAEQFDSLEQQRDASTLGMWVFLVTEVMFFGGLFTAYTVYRWSHPAEFAAASQHLDVVLGTVNTAVLICSSLTMALAVHAAALGRRRGTAAFLALTIVLGAVFLVIKGFEYAHKFHEDLVPGSNFGAHGGRAVELFFSLYFAMTGLHALHMVIGIVILAILTIKALRGRYTSENHSAVEVTGLYWHFVDVVWIFLFPLLYLIGRH